MSGIEGQFGYKTETTNGTAVTVDTFLPYLSANLKNQITRINSQGKRAGRRVIHAWRPGAITIGGPVELELPNIDVAPLFTHMFGTVSTTGAGPFTHTYTPGDLDGDTFTAQVGKPDSGGTVRPFTYAGCKVASWEIACGLDELAKLTLNLSAWSETTATALAAASYDSTWVPFSFVEGSLTIAGAAPQRVSSVSLTGDNALKTDRHNFGAQNIIEQLENGMRSYGGQVLTDFESLTAYSRFVDGTEAALVLAFSNGSDSLTITNNVRFDGETPDDADELLEQPLPFACVSATSDAAAITAVLVNQDASAA